MTHIPSLHTAFTDFLDRAPKLPTFAPAFFMESVVITSRDKIAEPVEAECPFETFWMVYDSGNGPLGTAFNIVLIQGRQVTTWVRTALHSKLGFCVSFDMDDPASFRGTIDQGKAIRETVPEIRLILDRIMNHEREEVVPPMLKRLNKKRVLAQKRKIPAFITIKPTLRVIERVDNGGTGSPKAAHNRRAHYRTSRKTGVRYPVREARIHGGTIVARDYRA